MSGTRRALLALVLATALRSLGIPGAFAVEDAGPAYDYDQAARVPDISVGGGPVFARFGGIRADAIDEYDGPPHVVRTNAFSAVGFFAPQTARPLFSQTTASSTFRHGPFAGQSIDDVAAGIRAGKISPAELPIDVIIHNSRTIGMNTRSMLALRRAGVDSAEWLINDVTSVGEMERLLTERLLRNQLPGGTDLLRITGAGPCASNLP